MSARIVLQRMARQRVPLVQARGYSDAAPRSGGGGSPLVLILGIGALAGGVWYATRPAAPGPTYGQQASQHSSNAGTALSNAASEAETAAKEAYNSAAARGSQGLNKTEGAWSDVKGRTSSAWGQARDEASGLYDKALGKGEEAKRRAERSGKDAKQEARAWFSWGESKANDAIDKARDDLIWAQREAAKKTREGADAVKKEAKKYE